MKNEALREAIIAEINEMNQDKLVELNNTYCDLASYRDSFIYNNDESFFDTFNFTGLKVAQASYYGDYCYGHDYVMFDGYGNFKSFCKITKDDLVEYPESIADYIIDNYNAFDHLFTEDIFNLINEAQ